MIDIIGDIHGHCDELTALLIKMGYENDGVSWAHQDRKALFLGDYIDRGPNSPEVLKLVRNMVENDQAIALMGNHELNAILFHAESQNGGHIRPHSLKNFKQHAKTLIQFAKLNNGQNLYEDYINWFKTLPLYFEDKNFRAIHATWHHKSIESLKNLEGELKGSPNLILNAGDENHKLYTITENLLKGVELPLPDNKCFLDKDGHPRYEMRIKWWKDPEKTPFLDYGFGADLGEYDGVIANEMFNNEWYYSDEKPVFFGHYWLNGTIELQNEYVCCLDYSIGKKDRLVAYRYDGEQELNVANIVYVKHK